MRLCAVCVCVRAYVCVCARAYVCVCACLRSGIRIYTLTLLPHPPPRTGPGALQAETRTERVVRTEDVSSFKDSLGLFALPPRGKYAVELE